MSLRRARWSWAFYDWANSAFATTVMAGFFPLFFSAYWAHGLPPGTRTFWLGVASSASSVVVMIIAPLHGGLADRKSSEERRLGKECVSTFRTTLSLDHVQNKPNNYNV